MATGPMPPLPFLVAITLALVALGGVGCDGDGAATDDGDAAASRDTTWETVFIEMRVWQHVDDSDDIWISARPEGGRWDTLGTVPFLLEGLSTGFATITHHRHHDLAIADVELRVWQRVAEPASFYVWACASTCPERAGGDWPWSWRLLGMVPLPLDDGHSPGYRYCDLTIAVPRGNPGLLEDREHLLALRDVLEGDGEELEWGVDRAAAEWEGVTVGGTPPRVTGLSLANHGLTGEIWGWLGDLTELTELRLDGNGLTSLIPSKLVVLKELTDLYLAKNDLKGCIPPPLRTVRGNDLDSLGLPDCPDPAFGRPERISRPGTYRFTLQHQESDFPTFEFEKMRHVVADVPAGESIRFEFVGPQLEHPAVPVDNVFDAQVQGLVLRDAGNPEVWLFLSSATAAEVERSHYSGCVYACGVGGSAAALVERLAASVWLNTSIGDDARECTAIVPNTLQCVTRWVWP